MWMLLWRRTARELFYVLPSMKQADERSQNEMYQCAEGHLFCGECSKTHAETQLGMQSTVSISAGFRLQVQADSDPVDRLHGHWRLHGLLPRFRARASPSRQITFPLSPPASGQRTGIGCNRGVGDVSRLSLRRDHGQQRGEAIRVQKHRVLADLLQKVQTKGMFV